MGLHEVLKTAATIAVAVVWFVALRPVALGGPASYIIVHGYSMSGTLAPGDLVVTMAKGRYSVGDAIVYHVPSGAGRGLLVVHRIVGVDPSGYSMQGDANSYQDPWQPKTSEVVGRLVFTLPGFGRVLGALANPFVLSIAWGLVALIMGLSFVPRLPEPNGVLVRTTRRRKRRRAGQSALEASSILTLCIMVGLVMLSVGAVISPAHAAGLNLHNDLLTARVARCAPPPPFSGACS